MNDAIFKFKRYEDSSLSYTGIDKHEDKDIGGWDTVIQREEYERLFYNQQSTMDKPGIAEEPEIVEVLVPEVKKPTSPVAPTSQKQPLVTEAYGIKKPDASKTPAVAPEAKPAEPELDLSGVNVGTDVAHKTFGTGKVTWIDKAGKHVRVTFTAGEKTFIFPDAFKQGFLKLI